MTFRDDEDSLDDLLIYNNSVDNLCDNLDVEPPGYKIISEEIINCTEGDLLRLWLCGQNSSASKYEEQDWYNGHPV